MPLVALDYDAAPATGRTVVPMARPPEHMRDLPPDYLERQQANLAAVAGGMDNLHFNNTKSDDSILWVRSGLAALILGQRVEEINRFFESEKFVWLVNPKFGFSLFGVDYMRLYALLNNRTGPMKGPLSQASQENFERQMWGVAEANSKIADAQRSVLDMEGSENHHLSSKTCDLLAAQFLKNIPEYADKKYDDGSTLAQQYEARRKYFLAWFDERSKRGQFVEAGSPSYQTHTLNALFNLRDFAEDPVLRKKAEMFLDLAYASMAEETLLTTRGGSKSRVKSGHEYNEGMSDRSYDLLFNAPGRTFVPLPSNTRGTSNYYPPPVVVDLARDIDRRGDYVFAKRCPGPLAGGVDETTILDDEGRSLWRTLDPEKSVLRYGFATPDYVLGSAGLDEKWLVDAGMGFRWQGIVFAGDPLARIGFEVKPADDKDWNGFNPFFSVQDRNILITQKWVPVPPNPASANPAFLRVYFSPTLDEVQEEGGWIFVKDGGAFAGIKVVSGGYAWTPAWKHADSVVTQNKSFITLDSENSPVIAVANQAADYNNDFNAFKVALKAQPIGFAGGVLRFATITFQGTQPGKVNGQTVDLAPSRGYNSPFIRSDWNSGLIYVRKGNETEILDFRDPKNPMKTIGAPITSAFPPGSGSTQPIIFGNSNRNNNNP